MRVKRAIFKKGDRVRLTKAAKRKFKNDPRLLKVGTVLSSTRGRWTSYATVLWGRDLVEAMAEGLLELVA